MNHSLKNIPIAAYFIILSSVFLNACVDRCTRTITRIEQVPVTMPLSELRSSFAVSAAKQIEQAGKIAIYKEFLFVIERGEGIHILDNSQPSSPFGIKFIELKGCHDVSIRSNILYAGNGPDLISISLEDLNNIKVVGRIKDAMNLDLVTGDNYIYKYDQKEVTEIQEGVDCHEGTGVVIGMEDDVDFNTVDASGAVGSMSRFIIVGDFMYVVDNQSLIPFGIKGTPTKYESVDLGIGGIETITATSEELYIGSTTGMFIFRYKDNPSQPEYVSHFRHTRACDPVVVKDDVAYVTLKGGNQCGASPNVLLLIDVKNSSEPRIIAEYGMSSPNGLGIDTDNNLFICDDAAGLKIYDATDHFKIGQSRLSIIDDIVAYDVILNNQIAIVSAKTAVYQYDYSDPANPVKLCTLFDLN